MGGHMWSFYVYEVMDADGAVIYVGKGSGNRKNVSLRERGGSSVREFCRFKRERDAYDAEVERIAEIRPTNNKCQGGNGSKAVVSRKTRDPNWVKEISDFGTRKYAARLWLACHESCRLHGIVFAGNASNVDKIRRVLHG